MLYLSKDYLFQVLQKFTYIRKSITNSL